MSERADTYVSPDSYVKVVAEKDDGTKVYEAGPRSNKYESGEEVPLSYAKSVLGSVNFRNRVYGLVDNEKEDTPDTYGEAQEIISDFNKLSNRMVNNLTDFTGVGPDTADNLREAGFESVDDIQGASAEDLAKVKGIGLKKARELVDQSEEAGRQNEDIEQEINELRRGLGS